MAFIDFQIDGLEEMRRRYNSLAHATPQELGLVRVMVSEAEIMMGASKRICPVLDGTLRSSGAVAPPSVTNSDVEVVLGYGGAARRYAFKVHENPRAGQTGGISPRGRRYKRYAQVGQWKFLETPVVQRRPAYFDALAAEVAARIGGAA